MESGELLTCRCPSAHTSHPSMQTGAMSGSSAFSYSCLHEQLGEGVVYLSKGNIPVSIPPGL